MEMTEPANPWVTPQDPGEEQPASTAEVDEGAVVPLTGPQRPQPGVQPPSGDDQLPVRAAPRPAPVWVVGAHGGAGETTLAALIPGAAEADHAWPAHPDGTRPKVLVAARSSAVALERARLAAQAWAAGLVAVDLLGLAVTLDAPGRLPRELRGQLRVAAGGFPRVWELPFHDPWRFGALVEPETAPRAYRRMASQIQPLTAPTHL